MLILLQSRLFEYAADPKQKCFYLNGFKYASWVVKKVCLMDGQKVQLNNPAEVGLIKETNVDWATAMSINSQLIYYYLLCL